MANRRNTYTAVLFLAGLLCAAVFLCLAQGEPLSLRCPNQTASRPQTVRFSKAQPGFEDEARAPVLREGHAMKRHIAKPLSVQLQQAGEAFDRFTGNAGKHLNQLLDRDHTFIELYGQIQKLMGRRVMEDVVPQYTVAKLNDGGLAFAHPEDRQVDMTTRAEEMLFFAKRVRLHYRIPTLYVQAPSKLDTGSLPEGLRNYADAEADQFLSLLNEGGMDTLDLRPLFRAAAQVDPDAGERLFFRTDHHWTPAGAFLGYQAVCEKLSADYEFEIDQSLTSPASFERTTLKDIFLGSQGRRVGSLYAGLDDFELWTPTFPTSFTYSIPNKRVEREGSFESTLLFLDQLDQRDLYLDNPYTVYSGGDHLLTWAVNRNNPDGPRVLVLRDSFGCAFTPFLSLAAGQVIAVDPRVLDQDQDYMLDVYLAWLKPDLILVLNTTSSLRSDALFPYLPSAWKAVRGTDRD